MYFAILWKNPEISKAELQLIQPTDISYPKKGVVMFETQHAERISTLGGIIKAGRVVQERDLPIELQDCKIIGIKEDANGKHLKKTIGIRRFKLVDYFHTDKEIKEKGKELINLGNWLYGIVEQYQNIWLYEAIDFDKPDRSMKMGMMPAKLTHIMINIWLNESQLSTPFTERGRAGTAGDLVIYDPFVGSWTTWFLANALGFDFIGSDINIKHIERNLPRWKTTTFYHPEHTFEIFQHDINLPFPKNDFSDISGDFSDLLIVTEGRLGPIVKVGTDEREISAIQQETAKFYQNFIIQINNLFTGQVKRPVIVFTIPMYSGKNYIETDIIKTIKNFKWWELSAIPEVYQRENQNIGRKILIVKKG